MRVHTQYDVGAARRDSRNTLINQPTDEGTNKPRGQLVQEQALKFGNQGSRQLRQCTAVGGEKVLGAPVCVPHTTRVIWQGVWCGTGQIVNFNFDTSIVAMSKRATIHCCGSDRI